jgi:hypothetical protein
MTTTQRLPTAARPRIAKAAKISEASIVAAAPRPELKTLFDVRQKPGYYNAESKAALLRRTKTAPHDELFVDFSLPECHIELRAGGTTLLNGPWTIQATAGGQPLAPAGPWRESCWERDDAYDYLEIDLPLSGGWLLERQILLARQDRFVLLADALIGPAGEACELHYAGSLPLDTQAAFRPAAETREGWLETKNRRQASIVPLALPEWRAEFCHAELSVSGDCISLEQMALGRNLYAPLWIDLDPRRLKRPLTWRRITVAENLAIVPRDVAAAYRVQVGGKQWVFYRSLAKRGNRTFLGHNTLCSFACRRLLASGETEDLVEIE